MAVRGNITLTDAASTPVNRVFYPISFVNNVLSWLDRTQAVLLGQPKLTCAQRLADKTTQATKVSWRLEAPSLAQTSGSTSGGFVAAPKVAYTCLFSMDFVLPAASTLQERKDLLAMARDLIDEAIVTNQVETGELIF